MKVFVTGATGFVGSALVQELLSAGHEVVGLTRSEAGAGALQAAGAEVQRGELDDLDSLRQGAAGADAVIHTAFNHDFARFVENCEQDRRAILALGEALAGSRRLLLVTSGTAMLAVGRVATELDMPPAPDPEAYPRASEAAARELEARDVQVSVVRLPPTVHGAGDHGFVPMLIDVARQTGESAYVGAGANRWPAVHRADAAVAFRLAMERGKGGERYHAIAEDGLAFQQIAAAIGKGLGVPVTGKTPEQAAQHFGWFHGFAAMDMAASSEATRRLLGWEPTGPGLLEDMAQAGYFTAPAQG